MSKLISVSDEVYTVLKEMKGEESYSSIIKKLVRETSNKSRVLALYGRGGVDAEKIKEVQCEWKKWSERYA